MEKYRVCYDNTISKVKIDSETAKFITIGRVRSMKMSNYACYFNTFEEAIAFIIDKCNIEIEKNKKEIIQCDRKIIECRKKIQEVGKIKESDD